MYKRQANRKIILLKLFFDDMDFQIVKVDGIHKVVLIKSSFVVTLEFLNIGIKPNRLAKIKLDVYKRQAQECADEKSGCNAGSG